MAKQGAKVASTPAVKSTVTAVKKVTATVAKAVPKITVTRLTGPIGAEGLPATYIAFSKKVSQKLDGASSKVLGTIKASAVKFATKGLSSAGGKAASKFLSKSIKIEKKLLNQLKANRIKNPKKQKSVQDLIKNAKLGKSTKGRTTQYEKNGGYMSAIEDFRALKPTVIRDSPELKIGTLNDGRTVIVRSKSSGDKPRPTLEIQNGKNKIKFRY